MINICFNSTIKNYENFVNTDLCSIMNQYGSDKGSGHHNYTILYDYLFKN
jgi:hypothetical protein